MQALSESKFKTNESPKTQQDSPTDAFVVGLAKSKEDPDQQIQMSSVQSLVTLQGKPNSKDSKRIGAKEHLSSEGVDDFSLFQQPIEGGQQETDVNNTFHEINQSVDQVCEDDPDFQSILSNRIRAQPSKENNGQTEEQKNAAQEALLQKFVQDEDDESYSSQAESYSDQDQTVQVANDGNFHLENSDYEEQKLTGLGSKLMRPPAESSKTARMHQQMPFMNTQEGTQQRMSKSSTRQKRPPGSFALPTFSNEVNATQQFELEQNLALQQNGATTQNDPQQQHRHQQMMQSLQQKLHINLKNLPSASGGSSSYSNKDLSERLQGIIRQRNQGHLTSGVSPTLNPGSMMQWPNDGMDNDSSNRTGTERDDPMLLSGQHGTPIQAPITSNMPPMPANMSQDPYFYLQWRQQKHKSCRSAHPNHQASYLLQQRKAASPGANARTLRLNQGKGRKGGAAKAGQVNDSTSSFSNSSNTTVPVKSLTEVKNPSSLITFRFVNRKVTHLNEIGRFRNLTELDVNGNLLQSRVPELLNLPFLKKLNLSGNQITEMWSLPKTLEILNISYNCLKKLDVAVMRSLSNLTTLEISNNGIESLEGLDNSKSLRRLIARNNQIQVLEPIANLQLLIEMDLENNPIDSSDQVLRAVQNKKDILLLNLKLAPLMVKVQNYDEFITSVSQEEQEDSKLVQDFKKLLTFLHNGTFYRRRKIYLRIRQQQQSLHIMERRFSNFSNDEDSSNGVTQQHNTQASGGAFSRLNNSRPGSGSGTNPQRRVNDKLPSNLGKNQRTNSTGLQYKARPSSQSNNNNPQRSQRYEAIISLYDKLLNDEDKLLLQEKRKEARERKLLRQQQQQDQGTDMSEEEEDDLDDDLDASIDDMDDDELEEDLLSDEFHEQDNQPYLDEGGEGDFAKGVDLDDLQTYHNQHFGRELNASTADFNKEIKQINQQLMNEGHLAAVETQEIKQVIVESNTDSPICLDKSLEEQVPALSRQQTESACSSDQIDAQEINVVVPIEAERSSRYTNRQHHAASGNQSKRDSKRSAMTDHQESSVIRQEDIVEGDTSQRSGDYGLNANEARAAEQEAQSNYSHADLSRQSRKTPQLSFKLDLAKIKNGQQKQGTNRASVPTGTLSEIQRAAKMKVTPGESVRNKPIQQHLISVRKIQKQITLAQQSERIPIKKSTNKSPQAADKAVNQNGTALETSYQSAQVVKKQEAMPLQQKQVLIPKLALQNIHRQQSDQSRNSYTAQQKQQPETQWKQTGQVNINKSQAANPKSLKVLTLSKRDDSVASSNCEQQHTQKSLTIKQSQITKTLQGKELLDLYEKVDHQRKVLNDVKRVLGNSQMTDQSIIDRILALQDAQRSLQEEHSISVSIIKNRHLMQIEDLSGQIQRLQEGRTLTQTKHLPANFLDQLEKKSRTQPQSSLQDPVFPPSGETSLLGTSTGLAALSNDQGGLTLRLKELRQATGLTSGGTRTAEQQVMLELLKQSSQDASKLAKTGRGQPVSSGLQPSLLELQNQQTTTEAKRLSREERQQIQKGGRSNSKQQKTSGRNSRREGNQTFELSSKREYIDFCQSPTGTGVVNSFEQEDNTLDRASNQDDILNNTSLEAQRKRKQKIVSDFNPGLLPSEEISMIKHEEEHDKSSALIVEQFNDKDDKAPEKDDSFRRVGFFLEKIKERNSSLQERLNLSFKKCSRLDQSSISYRPTTSFGNKKTLKGALIERECISLTRDLEHTSNTEAAKRPSTAIDPATSKTPNIVNQQKKGSQQIDTDSHSRLQKWDGMKPQLVRQMPHSQAQQIQTAMAKQSPSNNYIDFLQTGSVEMNGPVAKKSQQQLAMTKNSGKNKQPPKQTLSVLEETNQLTDGIASKHLNSTNVADQTENGPLFNFYQCTEVLHQLSSTSRGNNPHSSKNRSMLQPHGGVVTPNMHQQYSSLLNKQRSNNAIIPKTSSLLEHAAASQVIKQSTSFIQRANSLEMVPRLTPKQNNFIGQKSKVASNQSLGSHQPPPQLNNSAYHHQGSHSGSQSYWTTQQQIAERQSRNDVGVIQTQKPASMTGGSKTTKAAAAALHNPNLLNKSLQTYQRHSKGLNNSTQSQNYGGTAAGGVLNKYQIQLESRDHEGQKKHKVQHIQNQASKSSRIVSKAESKSVNSAGNGKIQKVLGAKNMVEKLQLQLKGLVQHQNQTAMAPVPRKTVQTDRARYQSSSNSGVHGIVIGDNNIGKGSRGVFATISQPEI